MAPQATDLATTVQVSDLPSATPSPTGSSNGQKPFAPVVLLILLAICLGYLISYGLYRYLVVLRTPEEEEDPSIAPDRGVSKFMNGSRLTLNLGSRPRNPNVPSDQETEQKNPVSESSPVVHLSPTQQVSSEWSIILTPEPGLLDPRPNISSEDDTPQAEGPQDAQVASAKTLSHDRVAAITADPKLAPVQVPLRPLSMHPSPTRGRRLIRLFSFGGKRNRDSLDPEKADGDVATP